MSKEWDERPIGYKQPPQYTRFQKGKSGNPRGRPRKPKPEPRTTPVESSLLDNALRQERDRSVQVNGSGGPQTLPMHDVIVRKLTACAAKGDMHALKEILKHWSELEQRDAARQQAEEEKQAGIFQFIVDLRAHQAVKWSKVEGTDLDPPDPWPHPDDIIIDQDSKRWRVRGPFDEKDVPYFEYCRAERDAMIAWSALRLRTCKSSGAALVGLWLVWDVQLPKRWQNFDRFESILFDLTIMPLRELRKLKDARSARVERLRPLHSPSLDKEGYRMVNDAMKPLFQKYGYRSLAQFERAYEMYGEAMPWPKAQSMKIVSR